LDGDINKLLKQGKLVVRHSFRIRMSRIKEWTGWKQGFDHQLPISTK